MRAIRKKKREKVHFHLDIQFYFDDYYNFIVGPRDFNSKIIRFFVESYLSPKLNVNKITRLSLKTRYAPIINLLRIAG